MSLRILVLVVALVSAAQALPNQRESQVEAETSSILVNAIIQRAIAYFRDVIYNGDETLELPVLDPFRVDHVQFQLPADLLSFELELNGANMTGAGEFHVERADLELRTLLLHYDVVVPLISIRAAHYKMDGVLITFLPLYGEGEAVFDVVNLRMVGEAQLGRSEDGRSIIIQEIREAVFSLDNFVARTTGYIGGGDIDKVINAMLSDIVSDYVTRFSRHISLVTTPIIRDTFNSVLDKLDTWEMLFG